MSIQWCYLYQLYRNSASACNNRVKALLSPRPVRLCTALPFHWHRRNGPVYFHGQKEYNFCKVATRFGECDQLKNYGFRKVYFEQFLARYLVHAGNKDAK